MFDAKTFNTSSKPFFLETIFQGQIEIQRKLPLVKKHRLLPPGEWLVGYPNKKGCFAAKETEFGIELRLMAVAPNEIKEEDLIKAKPAMTVTCPGWGFNAIAQLKNFLAAQG